MEVRIEPHIGYHNTIDWAVKIRKPVFSFLFIKITKWVKVADCPLLKDAMFYAKELKEMEKFNNDIGNYDMDCEVK